MKKYILFFLSAIFMTISLCCAVLPYGAVAIWAQTIVGIFALLTLITCPAIPQPMEYRSRWILAIKGSIFLLLCWTLIHAILAHFGLINVPAVGNSVLLPSTLYIWSAYIATAWAANRLCKLNQIFLKFIVISIVIIATFEAALGIISLYSDTGIFSLLVTGRRAVGTF